MASTTGDKSGKKAGGGLGETITIVVQALILAMIIRTFLFQPFSIPSGSMKPTLLIDDYLFVSKFSYGYSNFSFPFSPSLFEGRIWSGDPERGDIAVFRNPRDTSKDFIKRIVGLPGDEIQVTRGVLVINGDPVARERIDDFVENRPGSVNAPVPQYIETLPNGVSYRVLDLSDNSFADNTQVFEVPDGHYFMMGDNRDNSTDSRYLNMVGYVPAENLIGRAEILFFSIESDTRFWELWKWPQSVRWDRIFDWVE